MRTERQRSRTDKTAGHIRHDLLGLRDNRRTTSKNLAYYSSALDVIEAKFKLQIISFRCLALNATESGAHGVFGPWRVTSQNVLAKVAIKDLRPHIAV